MNNLKSTFANLFSKKVLLMVATLICTLTGFSQTFTIGSGTATNTNTEYPAPYGNWYTGAKHEFLVRASELTAAGVTSEREFKSLAFNVAGIGGQPLKNLTIKMAKTSATSLTGSFGGWYSGFGFTQVFNVSSYRDTVGWNTHTFSTPFVWDGTSNVVVQICFDNYPPTSYTYNAIMYYSTTSFNSSTFYYSDGGGACNINSGNPSAKRTNMRFRITSTGTAPVALCKNATIYLNASGTATLTADDIDNGSTSTAGIAGRVISKSSFNCSNVGANSDSLIVTDADGLSDTCIATVTVRDTIRPVAICKNITVTLSDGTASITPSQVNNGSNDSCGIQSPVLSKTSFDCSNIGDNTVTLTVKDNNNNESTCQSTVTVVGAIPECSIEVTPSSSTYTGGDPNKIYIGYGPQSVTLTATSTGGTSFSYSWSGSYLTGSGGSRVFTPTVQGNYNIVCTTKNNYGCEATCNVSICVLDIRASGSGSAAKVYVCHFSDTREFNIASVPGHLGHGDHLGGCDVTCGGLSKTGTATGQIDIDEKKVTELIVYPNPTNTLFNFKLESPSEESFSLLVYDINGRLEVKKENLKPNEIITLGEEFTDGLYIISVTQGVWKKTMKICKIESK